MEGYAKLGKCSQFLLPAPGYDRLAKRSFQYVPLWGMPTWFVYAPRRLECARCGIHVEYLPWALGKRPVTQSVAWFLASWAKLLSWQVVSRSFQTRWESVFRAVERAVDWGRERLDLTGISALGVDEIYWKKGMFLTLVRVAVDDLVSAGRAAATGAVVPACGGVGHGWRANAAPTVPIRYRRPQRRPLQHRTR